jgi:hypothetical protein
LPKNAQHTQLDVNNPPHQQPSLGAKPAATPAATPAAPRRWRPLHALLSKGSRTNEDMLVFRTLNRCVGCCCGVVRCVCVLGGSIFVFEGDV